MNCKPGDLAVIVRSPIHEWLIGRTVTVLHAAPLSGDFRMPDGFRHDPVRSERATWVCEFQSDIAVPVSGSQIFRMTRFAPVPDAVLRPIRPQPDDAEDEMLLKTGLPERNGVAA